MEFKALHFEDRLTVINPQGTIGVVTLWSKPDYVIERFRQAGVDLNPATSPIAVFGTLYGNGLREMLRNLLYNPQIHPFFKCRHRRSSLVYDLVSCGKSLIAKILPPLNYCYQFSLVPARMLTRLSLPDKIISLLGPRGNFLSGVRCILGAAAGPSRSPWL